MGRTAVKNEGNYYVRRLEMCNLVVLENLITGEVKMISREMYFSDAYEAVWLDITVKESEL